MAWLNPPKQKAYECNGALLKEHRQALQWTQEDLAFHSELSVRVVAKAEGGGTVQPDTLDQLAAALSTETNEVYPEDLAAHPEQIVAELLANLEAYRGEVVSKSRHLLADDLVWKIEGAQPELPFAGVHRGIEAVDRAIRIFFDLVEVIDSVSWQTKILSVHGNNVIASQQFSAQLDGLGERGITNPPPLLVFYEVKLSRGKVVSFIDHYPDKLAEENVRLQKIIRDNIPPL